MSDGKEQYDPPEVEQIPTEEGPSVTAAGGSQPPPPGVEWRPNVPLEDE